MGGYISKIKIKPDTPEKESYPFSLPAIKSLTSIDLHPSVTFFVGENGSGKSTLLESIAVAWGFNPEGGTKNFGFGTRESHSDLYKYIRLERSVKRPKDGFFLRSESFFNVATEIERLDEDPWGGPPIINSYGGTSLHEQSHGESFLALITNRFGGQGLYILDEPESGVSPQRQLSLLSKIHELVKEGSQFLIATHSPIVMAYPDSLIYEFSSSGLAKIEYEDSESVQVSRSFLMDRARMLKILME